MAQIFMDGFDHYGYDEDNMLDGPWAELTTGVGGQLFIATPSFGARTGPRCLYFEKGTSTVTPEYARRVLGGTHDELIIGMGIYLPAIPAISTLLVPMQFRDIDNNVLLTVTVRADGGIQLRSGTHTGTIRAQTTGPVLVAGSWEHLEMRIVRDASSGVFQVRVNEVEVLDASGLALGSTDISQLVMGISTSSGNDTGYYIDDLVVRDETGSYNNGFEGDLRVAPLQVISNAAAQGWATRSIQKLSEGVMAFLSSSRNQAIYYPDAPELEIADQDYTIEAYVRFNETLTGTNAMTIMGKYRSATNERSWRLWLQGPDDGSLLTFSTSVLGTTDVEEVHAFPFTPIVNRWYHIEIDRSGTDSYLFIDGIQKGTTKVDSRNYNSNSAKMFIGGRQDGSTTATSGASLKGWLDGVRLTIGSARHTANFTPPVGALPDNVIDDPFYDDVQLLLNFDEANSPDQSGNDFSATFLNSPVTTFPDDDEAYQTIQPLTPDDNDFVEADLVSAEGTLTFIDNPTAAQEVVLGSFTYTFVDTLTGADDVLIGATAADSMTNLIAAVNTEAGEGTIYGTGTTINTDASLTQLPDLQCLAVAKTPGTGGNSLASTTDVTNASWTDTTLSGGAAIPSASEFNLAALPPEITGVRAIALIGRNYKIDSGSSEIRMSFVTQGGSIGAGADRAVTLTPTYYEDTIEEDPATMGALTPSTVQGARIKLDRTT